MKNFSFPFIKALLLNSHSLFLWLWRQLWGIKPFNHISQRLEYGCTFFWRDSPIILLYELIVNTLDLHNHGLDIFQGIRINTIFPNQSPHLIIIDFVRKTEPNKDCFQEHFVHFRHGYDFKSLTIELMVLLSKSLNVNKVMREQWDVIVLGMENKCRLFLGSFGYRCFDAI